jgi:hypothetical protein
MSLTNIGRWISIVDGAQSLTQLVNYNQCQQVEPLPSSSGRLVGLLPCCGTCAHVPIGPEASRPFSLPYPLPLSLSFLISLGSTSAQGIPPTNAQCGWAHLSSHAPTPDLMSADAQHHLARSHAATMENLISLVNKLQWACTTLGDHGEESAPRRTPSQLPPMLLPCLWSPFLC